MSEFTVTLSKFDASYIIRALRETATFSGADVAQRLADQISEDWNK